MLNSKTLTGVLKDPKKALFHSKTKINLTFCDIEILDDVPKLYHKIEKLHLSHNKISKLNGIQQFGNITHLSLSFNQIKDWEELLKVENKEALVELNLKGNPLTAHPNYLFLIIERFPNLQRIDDLKISNEDRYYLQNYKLLSGKILPLYIQLKDDLALIEQNLQRMKLTAEIRQRDRQMGHQQRKSNKEKLEDLYYKMMHDLKNDQIFVEIHRILEKYTRFQSQSPILTLRIIDSIIHDIYENRLEQLVLDRKDLYTNYRRLFNDLMLSYCSQHDTSFDRFLTQKVLDNPSYDHWRFSEDNDHAFDCVLHEFCKLMPNQASTSHNVNFSFDDNTRNQEQENNNSDFLRNICVTHFPLFPLNLQYNNMILKMLLSQMEAIENLAVDTYLLLDSHSPIIKNLGNYKLFIESKMQTARARSQTPPSHRDEGPGEEIPVSGRSKRTTSVPPSKRRDQEALGSSNRLGLASFERNDGHNNLFVIPKGGPEFTTSSEGKTKIFSPGNIFLDSNAQTRVFTSGNKYLDSKTGMLEFESTSKGKRRNVLPLLLIVKFEANEKIQLKEGFDRLKEFYKVQRKAERKIIVEELCQNTKSQLVNNLKARIMQQWRERAQSKGKLLAVMKEVRYRKLEKYFRLLYVGCRRSRQELQFYYVKNLSLKVFYSMLHLRMKKKAILTKLLQNLSQKRNRIASLYLSKWKLMSSALKYSLKKSKMTKSLSKLPTIKRRPSSSDPRKYKELKEEAARLQTKKTMRELEPYFGKDKNIFRGCSACDYDV